MEFESESYILPKPGVYKDVVGAANHPAVIQPLSPH
jgi:hypothetical protein